MTHAPYLWETHLHTSETSICGRVRAAEMVAAYRRAGYHGLVITDHFLNGNSYARKKRPWQKRIDLMVCGFNAAREAGAALGMPILLGCEFSYEGGDFLTYGISEQFWRDQPDIADLSVDAYVARVHDAGGFVSQAHPFRAEWYMPPVVEKRWDLVDAFEVINGSHEKKRRSWDEASLRMAQEHGLLQTAGSDAHSLLQVGTAALAFPEPFTSEADFLAALRAGIGVPTRVRELNVTF